MKNCIAYVCVAVGCVLIPGCVTESNHYYHAVDEGKAPRPGSSIAVLCGRADGYSQLYARQIQAELQMRSLFHVLDESSVKGHYPEYPVNILMSQERSGEADYANLRKIGAVLGVDYVLAAWAAGYEFGTNGNPSKLEIVCFALLICVDDKTLSGASGFVLREQYGFKKHEGAGQKLIDEATRIFCERMLKATRMGRELADERVAVWR